MKKFQHYKGGIYELIAAAKLEATGKDVAVYKGEDGQVWVRPQEEFVEKFAELPEDGTHKILVRFCWPMRRSADVEGIFITTQAELEANYGKDVNFGEIAGKHSEVYGTFDPEDITVISEDQNAIAVLLDLFGRHVSGVDPLGTIADYEADHVDEEGEDD